MPIEEKFQSIISGLEEEKIRFFENEPLSSHCTFRIGGNAKLFVIPRDESQLIKVVSLVKETGVRFVAVGKGSNVIFPDNGFDGVVIATVGMNSYHINGGTVTADAGMSITELAAVVGKEGLTGLEFAYGIPGTIGGALFMNAGAYDGEISFILTESRYFDTSTGEIGVIRGKDHLFGYRESIYRTYPERIIIGATFSLSRGNKSEIESKMQDFMSRRREKQPLEFPSAGSSFKRYPGYFTAKLIDEAGMKGARVGGAAVSEKHAGFIINVGGATAADVRVLSDMIIEKIYAIHGFYIEREMIFIE